MLLNELTGVKKYSENTGQEVLYHLMKDGIEVLGKGRFALTLSKGSWDHVVKIFPRDDCYLKFLSYVSKNPSNKYLPRIIMKPKKLTTFFKHSEGAGNFYVVKIEKLRPLSPFDRDELEAIEQNPSFWVKASEELDLSDDHYLDFLKQHGIDVEKYGGLIREGIKITQDGDMECFQDLHLGNIMKRDNGEFVITDPILGVTKSEVKEFFPNMPMMKKLSVEISSLLHAYYKPINGPERKKQIEQASRQLSQAFE